MDYFAELPVDMYKHIFDYLSQLELTNILILNKLIYSQCMKYIHMNKFAVINTYTDFCIAYKKDQIITLKYFNDNQIIRKGFNHACDNANIFMMKILFRKGFRLICCNFTYLNELLHRCCITRDLFNFNNREKLNIEDLSARKYEKVIKYLIKCGATKCDWCHWTLNSGKLHN